MVFLAKNIRRFVNFFFPSNVFSSPNLAKSSYGWSPLMATSQNWKTKNHCLWPVPAVRENVDKVGRSVIHSFIHSSIHPLVHHYTSSLHTVNEWKKRQNQLCTSVYLIRIITASALKLLLRTPLFGWKFLLFQFSHPWGGGALSFRFLHSKSVMDLIHVEDK